MPSSKRASETSKSSPCDGEDSLSIAEARTATCQLDAHTPGPQDTERRERRTGVQTTALNQSIGGLVAVLGHNKGSHSL